MSTGPFRLSDFRWSVDFFPPELLAPDLQPPPPVLLGSALGLRVLPHGRPLFLVLGRKSSAETVLRSPMSIITEFFFCQGFKARLFPWSGNSMSPSNYRPPSREQPCFLDSPPSAGLDFFLNTKTIPYRLPR